MIIVVGAEKGGVGKTSLATNLACLAATDEGQLEVLLLDTDPQGSSSAWVRIRNDGGVTPVINTLTVPKNPLHELTSLAPKYDIIIIDIGAQNYATMLNAVKVADLILVPTGPDQLELESTLNVFDVLKSMGPQHKSGVAMPAYVVLNHLPTNPRSREEKNMRDYLNEENIPMFDSALRYRSAWRNSRRAGLAVHELAGRDADPKATAEMRAIYMEAEQRAAEVMA